MIHLTETAVEHLKKCLEDEKKSDVGVTIHGVASVEQGRRAFDRVAEVSHRHLGRSPVSYGMLVDDLHVYRAIVARRPIGLEHPQCPAARALRDVAKMILSDAKNDLG